MSDIKARLGLLVAVVVAVAALGAATASASSAPLVIQYQKTCNELTGYCEGTLGNVTIRMQVTGFGATGEAAQMTTTVRIIVGDIDFTAELSGHVSPAGFIVLNGTVTGGSFAGAQVHQRSNFDGLVGGDPTKTHWVGELQLAPASA